jgi:hypothetical protein
MNATTSRSGPRTFASRMAGFLGFAAAYYAPLAVVAALESAGGLPLAHPSVAALLREALTTPAVQLELARNAAAHGLLLGLLYAALCMLAAGAAATARVRLGVLRPALLVVGWLFLLALNGLLFPASGYAYFLPHVAHPAALAALGGLLLLGLGAAAWASRDRVTRRGVWLAGLVALPALAALALPRPGDGRAALAAPRHVFLIGVDSLSPQVLAAHPRELPTLTRLVSQAQRFERAYTPLARTFPAWMSILSGRPPIETGAIENLRPAAKVHTEDLVTHALRGRGYQTVLAIDERRFSAIDERYGFDRAVGPRVGVLDLLLQQVNDTPLTNLALQLRGARAGLPFSRLNVASHVNYDATGFVDETLDALAADRPVFLALHLESGHYPFKTRHAAVDVEHPDDFHERLVEAMSVADAQVAALLRGLEARGLLNDALVVVLSDHGDSLNTLEGRTTKHGRPIELRFSGHGTSVLSEVQNRVVLAALRYQSGRPVDPPSSVGHLVPLTDVRGIVESYVATGELPPSEPGRCMIVETGMRFTSTENYKSLDPGAVAAQAAPVFRVDRSGRLEINEAKLPQLVDDKDVGWRCLDRITYYSRTDNAFHAYRLDDLQMTEVAPAREDVARIEAYRARLRAASR